MRSEAYDRMKGFAIILMVMSHAMEPLFAPLSHWIYLFHMPVFFVLAGWFFKADHSALWVAVCKFIADRVKRLWWPYFFWTVMFVLLHNFFIGVNIYTDNPELLERVSGQWIGLAHRWTGSELIGVLLRIPLMGVSTPLSGAMWFLRALFFGACLYCICHWAVRRFAAGREIVHECVMTIIAVTLIAIGRYQMSGTVTFLLLRIGGLEMLTAFFLIHMGHLFRRLNLSVERLSVKIQVLVAVFGLGGLVALMPYGAISLGGNHFPSVTFLSVATCLGWFGLVAFSALSKSKMLAYVGRHTLPVLILHMLAFKVISYFGVVKNGDPVCMVAAIPTAYRGVLWACAYTVSGLTLPLAVDFLWRKLYHKIMFYGW